jgi:phage shock protein A
MPALSEKLAQLRPVTFHYKTDPNGVRQYGLIAEEVDQVYPELVIRDPKGAIQGVHYEELAPMLLNEIQRQQQKILAQDAKIQGLEQQVAKVNDLERELNDMHAALNALQPKDRVIAQR